LNIHQPCQYAHHGMISLPPISSCPQIEPNTRDQWLACNSRSWRSQLRSQGTLAQPLPAPRSPAFGCRSLHANSITQAEDCASSCDWTPETAKITTRSTHHPARRVHLLPRAAWELRFTCRPAPDFETNQNGDVQDTRTLHCK
jgi:hypothetical protein